MRAYRLVDRIRFDRCFTSALIGVDRRLIRHLLFCAVCAIAPLSSFAADAWPSRPVRIIAPFPPGSGVDIIARVTAQALTESLKQPFVVENRAGAGGTIGSDLAAKAPPDGY